MGMTVLGIISAVIGIAILLFHMKELDTPNGDYDIKQNPNFFERMALRLDDSIIFIIGFFMIAGVVLILYPLFRS